VLRVSGRSEGVEDGPVGEHQIACQRIHRAVGLHKRGGQHATASVGDASVDDASVDDASVDDASVDDVFCVQQLIVNVCQAEERVLI